MAMTTKPCTEATDAVDDNTKTPFLRRVRIRGYKSIGFCDVSLEPLTVLVGRNAAGKSNFLDALAFLRDAMAISIPEAVKRRNGWRSILSRRSDDKEIRFDVEMSLSSDLLPSPNRHAAASMQNSAPSFL